MRADRQRWYGDFATGRLFHIPPRRGELTGIGPKKFHAVWLVNRHGLTRGEAAHVMALEKDTVDAYIASSTRDLQLKRAQALRSLLWDTYSQM
jgi:hypothetical protein